MTTDIAIVAIDQCKECIAPGERIMLETFYE